MYKQTNGLGSLYKFNKKKFDFRGIAQRTTCWANCEEETKTRHLGGQHARETE